MSTREMTGTNFAEMIETGTVFVDWWAPWCGPCRAFGPVFEAAAAKHREATFAKVNTEIEQGLAAAFDVRAIPTLMVFRDGILLFREAGLLPASALEELIRRVGEIDMDDVRRQLAEADRAAAEAPRRSRSRRCTARAAPSAGATRRCSRARRWATCAPSACARAIA